MSEAMVQVRNVSKVYERGKQKVPVLQGLTLDIPKGDFVALMGPSGSGKTTLLNLIGGLDQPTSGEILVGGSRIDKLSAGQLAKWRAGNVGFVFQFYNLMPVLTAEGNVELPLLLTKLGKAQRRKNVGVALDAGGLAGEHQRRLHVVRHGTRPVVAEHAEIRGHHQPAQDDERGHAHHEQAGHANEMHVVGSRSLHASPTCADCRRQPHRQPSDAPPTSDGNP